MSDKKHIDEIYKDWCGEHHTTNSSHPVHDSSEACDFADYYYKIITESNSSLPHSVIRSEYLKYKEEFDTEEWIALDDMYFYAWFMYGWRKHEEYLRSNEA